MKFSGYWVCMDAGKVTLRRTAFDESELDPATQWKQAWQNQDDKGEAKGFVDLGDAQVCAATQLARVAGQTLTQMDLEQVRRHAPDWQDERCEFPSLAQLFDSAVR